jgi:hypothetical protein
MLAVGSAPAVADHGHASRHHVRHHFRRHDERFGPAPTAPSTSDAGTVMSLTNGVLTIKLNDGSTVSGMVTNNTEIECRAIGDDRALDGGPGPSGGGGNDADNDGGNNGDNGDNGGDNGNGDNGDRGNDNANCAMGALAVGAVVRDAELSVSNAGSFFTRVDLEG